MFTKISLALTILLGSAWAVLAQNYVNQMAPRARHHGSVEHRATPVDLFEGRDAGPNEQFKICVTDEGQGRLRPCDAGGG
jgi:hypothetical protein